MWTVMKASVEWRCRVLSPQWIFQDFNEYRFRGQNPKLWSTQGNEAAFDLAVVEVSVDARKLLIAAGGSNCKGERAQQGAFG
jgi:hypothetical protein